MRFENPPLADFAAPAHAPTHHPQDTTVGWWVGAWAGAAQNAHPGIFKRAHHFVLDLKLT
ncbi:hypothetical protein NTCA1_32560 [Novosphingobium sp. TCA1]|nr:hypothetical protein NTCA1_32560 [Novosphingobium sp. TCA1]